MAGKFEIGDAILRIAPSLDGFKAKLDAMLKTVNAELDVTIKPDIDKFVTEFEALIATASAEKIDITVDADTAKAKAEILALKQLGDRTRVRVDVDADTDDVDRKVNETKQKFRVVQGFTGITLFSLGNISAAAAGIHTIIGLLGGVVAAAGAVVGTLGLMAGAVAIGLQGVIGAFSELRKAKDKDAKSAKDEIAELRKQREAIQRVHDAKKTLSDATRTLADDQKALAEATKDATREIRDQRLELEDAKLAQEGSAIAVARAKERLAEVRAEYKKGQASGLDLQEATLNVRSAQNRLRQSQNELSDKKGESRQVFRNGVENNPKVVDAGRTVEESKYDIGIAKRELADAEWDLANPGGSGGGTDSMDKFNELMKKLSPNAQDFVQKTRSLGAAWTDLRMTTQDALFDGLGDTLVNTATKQFPEFQRGMNQLAGTANGVFKDTMNMVSDTFTEFTENGKSTKFWDAVSASFANFAPVIDSLVRSLTDLTIGMGPALATFFGAFAEYMNNQTPMWTRIGAQTLEVLSVFLGQLDRMFRAMEPIFSAGLDVFVRAMEELTTITEDGSDGFTSFVESLGDGLVNAMRAVAPLLPVLVGMFTLLADIVAAIPTPLLTMAIAFTVVGRSFFQAFIAIGNTAGRIMAAGESIAMMMTKLKGLTPVLGTIFKFLSATAIGRVISAVVLLGGAFMMLYHNSETFRNIISEIGGYLSKLFNGTDGIQAASSIGLLLLPLMKIKGVSELIESVSGRMWGAIVSGARGAAVAAMSASKAFLATALSVGRTAVAAIGMAAARAATMAWTAAQWLLNAALKANPIGIVITALVALAAGLVYAYRNSETFRNFVDSLWGKLKEVGSFIANVFVAAWEGLQAALQKTWEFVEKYWRILILGLGPIGLVVNGIMLLIDNFDNIKSGLSSLKDMWGEAWDWIGKRFDKVRGDLTGWLASLKDNFKDLGSIAGTIGGGIKTAFSGVVEVLKAPVKAIGKILQRIPTKILGVTVPGATTLHTWGDTLANLSVGGSPAGAGRKPNGKLYGPGTGTSDSILGVNEMGVPTALVSTDEAVVNARGAAKYWPVIDAINKDTLSAMFPELPRFANGSQYDDWYGNVTPKPAAPRKQGPGLNPGDPQYGGDAKVAGPGLNPGDPQYKSQNQYAEWYGDENTTGKPKVAAPDPNNPPFEDYSLTELESFSERPDSSSPATYSTDTSGITLSADEKAALAGGEVATSLWKAVKGNFPDARLSSAKANHSDDGGYHPAGKAIDIVGSPDLMLEINHWLYDEFGSSLAELIFAPAPPAKLMYNKKGQLIDDQGQLASQVYAGDLPGHQDHVHVSADDPVSGGTLDGDVSGWSGDEGFEDSLISTEGYNAGGKDKDSGPKASTAIKDAMRGDLFDPRRYAQNLSLAASDILWDGVLNFFGLDDFYLDAYGDIIDEKERLKGQGGTTGNVGDGSVGTDETDSLLDTGNGYVVGEVGGAMGESVEDESSYEPGAGVEQWRPLFRKILNFGGWSLTNLEPGMKQMETESGGDPGAQNDWDSNAAKGTPSKGLMQVIDPTFDAFKSAELPDDIWNPAANIFAATNYAVDRYGPDLRGTWGHGRGYKDGGPIVGPGGPRSDDIPIWASSGEYMVNARSAAVAGPLLEAINKSPELAGDLTRNLAVAAGGALSAIPQIGPAIGGAVMGAAPAVGEAVEFAAGGLAVGAETLTKHAAKFLSQREQDRIQAIQTLGGVYESAPLTAAKAASGPASMPKQTTYGDVYTASLREFKQFIDREEAHEAFAPMASYPVR